MRYIIQFFNPYDPFVIRRYNWWFCAYQGYFNIDNVFILHWQWICTKLHPEVSFGFTFLGFVLPVIDRHRSLLAVNFYTWAKHPMRGMLSIAVLYLPELSFYIGNGRTWFSISCYNWIRFKIKQNGKKGISI